MAKLIGVGKVVRALKRLVSYAKANYQGGVTVGFAQPYAVAVHEMVLWKHRVGQAKYLETAMAELKTEVKNDIAKMLKNKIPLQTALLLAGAKIQKRAQQLTPVDTGALKASGFTSKVSEENAAAEAAHRRGEAVRAKHFSKLK